LKLYYRPRPLSGKGVIGDEAMDTIKELKNLEALALNGTRITDAGADKIKELPNIGCCFLDDTNVSNQKKQEIEEHCIKCFRGLFDLRLKAHAKHSSHSTTNLPEPISYSTTDSPAGPLENKSYAEELGWFDIISNSGLQQPKHQGQFEVTVSLPPQNKKIQ
jgi:hypothetical protein